MNKNIKNFEKAFSKLNAEDVKEVVKIIQATDGGKDIISLENLLFGIRQVSDIDGTENKYQGYAAQVVATYLKYQGLDLFGCWLTKAIIDLRVAFIAGEGLSVSAKNNKTSKWIEDFLTTNKFNGSIFFRAVKGGECTGKALLTLKYDTEKKRVKIIRIPYGGISTGDGSTTIPGVDFRAVPCSDWDVTSIQKIVRKKDNEESTLAVKHFVYVILGGDDTTLNNTNTKVGMVLTEIENYDKALKELRRSNYVVNRITPYFQCKDDREAVKVRTEIQNSKWKIGKALVSTANFKYESPSTSAHDNVEKELQANAKAISTITGVPVHWIGHTELMSNRATAESLYETIDNQTKIERVTWSESMYDLILKAMEIDIDSGFSTLSKIDKDFEVKIPLISFRQFKDNIAALSMAYADRAISIEDYMNFIPGIDPLKTKKAIEAKEKEDFNNIKTDAVNDINDKNLNDPKEDKEDE